MRPAHRWLTLLVLLLVAAPVFGQRNKLSVGDSAPGLDIDEWVAGQEVSIRGGQVFVVVFWSTTSASSKAAMPHLSELQDEFGDQGLTVVGISSEDGGADLVKPYVMSVRRPLPDTKNTHLQTLRHPYCGPCLLPSSAYHTVSNTLSENTPDRPCGPPFLKRCC